MSLLLPEAEIARLRTDIENLTLPDTCTILTGTLTVDGMGGNTTAWGTTSTGVACRLDAHKGYENLGGAAIRPYQSFTLTVPQSTTLTTEQRIIHNSVTYNVTSVNAGSWLTCKRAILEVTA